MAELLLFEQSRDDYRINMSRNWEVSLELIVRLKWGLSDISMIQDEIIN